MTKIYRQPRPRQLRGVNFWVTCRVGDPRYFCMETQVVVDSIWTEANLRQDNNIGLNSLITPAAALALLADWPEGLAELERILGTDNEGGT